MLEHLQAAVNRVLAGTHDELDLREIVTAIQAGQVILATGERAIAIGGDANDSVNVSGNHNHIIVINGVEAEEIAQLVQRLSTAPTLSVDELSQQVRSRASAKILNLFSKIRLLNKRQIEVEQLYVDVYVLEKQDFRATIPGLLEGRDVWKQFDRFGLGKRGERSPGLAIATSEDHPRLMVLGKPGSGKSTFLCHLAVGCAKGKFLGDYIPVLLELRDVDDADFRLFQWIHEELGLEQEAQTEQILKWGQVLILLDGLDEVPSSLLQKVQSELRKFAKRYSKNRFILSCRTQTTEYIPEQFQALEVADFNPEQVDCFALNWFTTMAEIPEHGAALKNQFMEKLQENPQTIELATTPVLLSLICWVFDDLKSLPQKRSDLYREGLDLLLQQWDEGRGISRNSGCDLYRQLTIEERKQLLSYLAFRKFEQAENFVLFEEPELCGYIAEYLQISVEESRAVLRVLAQQHGLLIERAQRIWSFSHLTFQEYLVASWYSTTSVWKDSVGHINDQRWHEVFLLTAELLDDGLEFLQLAKQTIDFVFFSDEKLLSFLSWLNQKSLSCKSIYKVASIRALYLYLSLDTFRGFGLSDFSDAVFPEVSFKIDEKLEKNFFPEANASLDEDTEEPFFNSLFPGCIANDLNLYEALNLSRLHEFDIIFTNEVQRDLDLLLDYAESLYHCLDFTVLENPSLEDELQMLRSEFLNSIDTENAQSFAAWWIRNQETWVNCLRDLMIKHCNIGYDWQMNEEQEILLEEYYNSNSLLVDCLNIANITLADKNSLEGELFLPIAEIEKRRSQSSD